jgi:hypothetical protein
VYFSTEELRTIKLAAVTLDITASEFCRQAALRAAVAALKDFTPPTLEDAPSTAHKRKAT